MTKALKLAVLAVGLTILALVFALPACHEPSAPPAPPVPAHVEPQPHHTLGSPLDQPFPSEWQTAQWYIDPANSTGCASDNNTGTSATCGDGGGVGPLLTWQGLNVLKWGCRGSPVGCPRLRQNTTITFLSGHTNNSDPVVYLPQHEAGAWSAIVGAGAKLQATGTLANVTAKNRSTPQLLQASVTIPDGGVGLTTPLELIVNTTHPSHAWTYAQVSGGIYSITEPIAPLTIGSYAGTATEVDTWANGDAVSIYYNGPVTAVNLVRVAPTIADYNGTNFANAVYLSQIQVYDPQGCGYEPVFISDGVVAWDSYFTRAIQYDARPVGGPVSYTGQTGWGFINSVLQCGGGGGPSPATSGNTVAVLGGQVVNTSIGLSGGYFDDDVIIGKSMQGYQAGNVYVASGQTWTYSGSSGIAGFNSGEFWGAGTVNANGDCRVSYPSGASKAAATFVGVTLNANGTTATCIDKPSAASAFATCNTTLTAANLDTNLGATTGCLVGPGAAYCNAP